MRNSFTVDHLSVQENRKVLQFCSIKNDMDLILIIFYCVCACSVNAQILSENNTILCRQCHNASSITDCKTMVQCDSTLEECFMEEDVTDQLTLVYTGGCIAKSVCRLSSRRSKRCSDLFCCSRCCDFRNDCNALICGVADRSNGVRCYSCDGRNLDTQVTDPRQCITDTACQSNEMCYSWQSDIPGRGNAFYSGCLSKLKCQSLMQKAYEEHKRYLNKSTSGNFERMRRQGEEVCHSCCVGNLCNYGTCMEMNDRIFDLADRGLFNMTTLTGI